MSEKAESTNELGKTGLGIYSIFASAILRPDNKYNLAFCLHNAVCPAEIKIMLKGVSYEATKTIKVQPMTVENVDFNIPLLCKGDYELIVEGIKGLIFQESKKLYFEAFKPIIIIQTDKAIYKQADVLRFRVLFMNENTLPIIIQKPISITIMDDKKIVQKQWLNIEYKNGVYLAKYRLLDKPSFGQWTINVSDGIGVLATKTFDVDKYVLPKYELSIETERHVLITDKVINVIVRAKAFKGKVTISIVAQSGWDKGTVLTENTIDINEKGEVQFQINQEMTQRNDRTFKIVAEIKESLFGDKESIVTLVTLHRSRFTFECVAYTPGEPCNFQIAIKHFDGSPVLDTKNAVNLHIEKRLGHKDFENKQLSNYLDERGIVTFEAILPEVSNCFYHLNFKYLDCEEAFICLHVKAEDERTKELYGLQLIPLTKNPLLGNTIEIRVKSNLAIPYYVYMIVARGKLLKAEFVNWPEKATSHVIKFERTFDMMCRVSIFVHYVVNAKLYYAENTINFNHMLENNISLTAPDETRIGEDVVIEVKSKPNSYVGLLATNQKNYNHFSIFDVFDKLNAFECRAVSENDMRLKCGGVLLTNALEFECGESYDGWPYSNIEPDSRIYIDTLPRDWKLRKPKLRKRNYKEFPENWLFEDIENTTADRILIRKTMPDTPTTWYITAFSLNAETGLGLTEKLSTVNTFRPFFISTKLPFTLRRGEEFSLPVLVFNNTNQDISAKVTLHNDNNEFKILNISESEAKLEQFVSVSKNTKSCVNFHICATNIGQIALNITADCHLAADALLKILQVIPEGVTIFKSEDFQVLALENGTYRKEIKELEIPKNVVSDSVFIEANLLGDILGLNRSKLERLLRKPCGNGEQNIIGFTSNIYVLQYLEFTNEVFKDIEEKAKQFLEIGYERELNYKLNDGSYSTLDKSVTTNNIWLTAYVMRSFHQAKKYINIDPQLLDNGLIFLAKFQAPNGCFTKAESIVDSDAAKSDFGLTAFVLLAFLENTESIEKYSQNIKRGFEYLQQNFKTVKEMYPLSIALYAFQKQGVKIVPELLARFQLWAINDSGLKWWAKERNADDADYKTCSVDIEITAYVMLTLLEMECPTLPIARWLINQIDSFDDFKYGQATLLSLEALIKFVSKSNAVQNTNLKVIINAATSSKTFDLNESNRTLKQNSKLPNESRQIVCSIDGTGSCFVQLLYRYNILEKVQNTATNYKFITQIKSTVKKGSMSMNICLEFPATIFERGHFISNFIVMEIFLPSGYLVIPETLDKVKKIENVKHVESQDCDTKIVIYIDNVKSLQKCCIPITAKLMHGVFNRKPVPIVICDFHNRQIRDYYFYKIEESLDDLNINNMKNTDGIGNPNSINKICQYLSNLFERA